ncbi:hypothetical protein AOZ07_16800 [Glutamicibacter halophytocola]|uniref:hypothetical protein n=1 Tax=Glutamicibacter halophytocola TaxID=1933880 RepID=UPI0006D4B216|nr:hypothetical protein [Glutamicibacter halophytocola]ALG30475.1 hypothetical protein AOZ07_16800 [Glutamicibacter halophytocola]
MFTTHVVRQRIILVILGLALLAGGGWGLASVWWGLPAGNDFGQAEIGNSLPIDQQYLVPLGLAIGIAGMVLSLAVLITAIPRRPAAHKFRYESRTEGVSEIETSVIAKAAETAAQTQPEIVDANVQIGGSATEPVLYARFTLRADAPANRGIELVNDRVIPDLEMVLGAPFASKHVSFSFQKPEKQDSQKAVLI